MSPNQNHQETASSNAGSLAMIANVVKAMKKRLPSSQEEQAEDKLNQARDLVSDEVSSFLETDVKSIEEKIT